MSMKMVLRQKTADEKAKAVTRGVASAMAVQRCIRFTLKYGKPTESEMIIMAAAIAAEVSIASLAIYFGNKIVGSQDQ